MRMNLMQNENTKFGFLKCLDDELDLISKIAPLNHEDGSSEVEFKVNGIELNFGEFMNYLMDCYDKCVIGEAKELVKKKYEKELLPDVDEEIYAMQNQLQSIQENINELLQKSMSKIDEEIIAKLTK